MGSNVVKVGDSYVAVTPENYSDVTRDVWASKNVTDNQTKLSIAEALRNLAFGNTTQSTRNPLAESVINQPTVRLSDRIATWFGGGNTVDGGSFLDDLQSSAHELAKNFHDKYIDPPDGSPPAWKTWLYVGGLIVAGAIAYKLSK